MASKPKIRLTPMRRRWTAEEAEDARYMMRLFSADSTSMSIARNGYGLLFLCRYTVEHDDGYEVLTTSSEIELNQELFPSLRNGEEASLTAIYLGVPAEREDINAAYT